jgi:hypothetical protein
VKHYFIAPTPSVYTLYKTRAPAMLSPQLLHSQMLRSRRRWHTAPAPAPPRPAPPASSARTTTADRTRRDSSRIARDPASPASNQTETKTAPRQLQHAGQDGGAGKRAAHRVTQVAADSQQHRRFPSAQHQIGHDTRVCSQTRPLPRVSPRARADVFVFLQARARFNPAARLGAPPAPPPSGLPYTAANQPCSHKHPLNCS